MENRILPTVSQRRVVIVLFAGKQTLKVFDGDDAVKRNQFRLVSTPRITKNEEVVVSALVIWPYIA